MSRPTHRPQVRRNPPRVGMLSIALLLWFLSVPAWCANKPAAKPAAPAPVAASAPKAAEVPEVFEVTEIVPRSERAFARLREIRAKLDADSSPDFIDRELPALRREMDEQWKAGGETLKQGYSAQRLNDLLFEWSARSDRIDAWKLLLASSSKDWIAEQQAIDRAMANWQATRAALDADAPPVVRERVAEVLRDIEATRRLFRDKTSRLIAVQARLEEQQQAVGKVRRELEALRKQAVPGLWARDSLPLWAVLDGDRPGQSLAAQAGETVAKLLGELGRLFEVLQAGLIGYAFFFALLYFLFRYLRRLSASTASIHPTPAEQIVLDRGLFSALLLTLGLIPVLYADASPRLIRLLILPALIPILALTPAILAPRLRMGFYLFSVILLLDVLRNYLPTHWGMARLLLLSVSGLGVLGLAIMALRHRREAAAAHRTGGLMGMLLLAGVALFAVSIGANVVGNQTLAELLVSPIVRLLFIGVVIRLGVAVTTTLVVMALRSPVALLSRIVRERGAAVAIDLRRLAVLSGVVLWTSAALFNLGLLAAAQDALDRFLGQEWQVGAAVISMREIVMFFVVLFATYVLSRLLRTILADEIFPRFQFPRGVPDAMTLLARYGVLLFGFLLALTSAGVNLSQVTLAISALGVGIGFGLQNVVNNFVSGLILVFEHPIQVGDYIEVGPHYGQMKSIGFRSSRLLTRDGSDVIIPNAELIGTKVINWSLSNAMGRVKITVPVAVGTDAGRVIEVLQAIARDLPQVLADPPPSAILQEFGDQALKFQLRCWAPTEHMSAVHDALTFAIDQALRDAGIEAPKAGVNLHFPDPQPIRVASADLPK